MNISGRGYSKATKALRASKVIKDQHFKLVFTYPMLFDKSVAKYGEVLRDFLATTMLKELFVSNALKLVSMASEIHPLTDERGDELHTSPVLSQIIRQEDGRFEYETRAIRNATEQIKPELQRKIHDKTAIIKQLLSADHKLKQLRPYIEIITMDNMVDVPVIVGTKMFDVFSTPMLMVLLVSITNQLKLNNPADVAQIFRKIKNVDESQSYKLFNNLLDPKAKFKTRVKEWLLGKKSVGSVSRKVENFRTKLVKKQLLPTTKTTDTLENPDESFNMDESLSILATAKSDLKQAELFFKFMLEPDLLKSQFGLDHTNEQISTVTQKLAGPISNIFVNLMNNFVKSLDVVGQPVTNGLINIFYPQGMGVDQTQLDDELINRKLLDDVFNLVYGTIRDTILLTLDRTNPEEADKRIKSLKGLCQGTFKDSGNILMSINDDIQDSRLTSPTFSRDQWYKFNAAIEKAAQKGNKQSKRVEAALDEIIEMSAVSKSARAVFEKGVDRIFNKLETYYTPQRENMALLRNGLDPDPEAHDEDQAYNRAKTQYISNISSFLYFLFMFNLQNALCEYVDVVEVDVETATNDVTEFPNFSLVLPLESIMACAAAFRAKKWQDLIKREGSDQIFMSAMNDNYAKGVVKFIINKLGVPNVFVIDEKKGILYYRLMHQTSVQKTNLRTLDNFIKLTSQQELKDTSNRGFY